MSDCIIIRNGLSYHKLRNVEVYVPMPTKSDYALYDKKNILCKIGIISGPLLTFGCLLFPEFTIPIIFASAALTFGSIAAFISLRDPANYLQYAEEMREYLLNKSFASGDYKEMVKYLTLSEIRNKFIYYLQTGELTRTIPIYDMNSKNIILKSEVDPIIKIDKLYDEIKKNYRQLRNELNYIRENLNKTNTVIVDNIAVIYTENHDDKINYHYKMQKFESDELTDLNNLKIKINSLVAVMQAYSAPDHSWIH